MTKFTGKHLCQSLFLCGCFCESNDPIINLKVTKVTPNNFISLYQRITVRSSLSVSVRLCNCCTLSVCPKTNQLLFILQSRDQFSLHAKQTPLKKLKKTSCQIYKHLVQQQVPQVVHNVRDICFLYTYLVFRKQ